MQLCSQGLRETEEKRKQELFPFQGVNWEKKGFCRFPSVTPAGLEGSQELRALHRDKGVQKSHREQGTEQRPHHAVTHVT